MARKKLEVEKELFYDYLRQNGLKKTHQKDLILETFLDHEGHLSVEDIYALVKKRDKKVGIVTVFRTLKSLTACGIAKEITLGDGLTRFEHSYLHPIHHHIICTECRKVIEFVSPELERVQGSIVSRYNFQPLHQRIQIFGVCNECREQRPAVDGPKPDTGKIFARDALRMALAMHEKGMEFYRSAASHNMNPAGREVFETIVQEESEHARALERELELLQRQEKGLAEAPVFLHFDPCELQQLVPCLQSVLSGDELHLDAHRALEMAMDLEARAAGFFQDYSERFQETEGKRIFRQFAERAMEHHAAIRERAMTVPSSSV